MDFNLQIYCFWLPSQLQIGNYPLKKYLWLKKHKVTLKCCLINKAILSNDKKIHNIYIVCDCVLFFYFSISCIT